MARRRKEKTGRLKSHIEKAKEALRRMAEEEEAGKRAAASGARVKRTLELPKFNELILE
jgi:hypothetical protein